MSVNNCIFIFVSIKKMIPPFAVCNVVLAIIMGATVNSSPQQLYFLIKNSRLTCIFYKIKLNL